MRLERQQEEVLRNRKGLTGKTIVQTIWLAISFAVAYFLINYILTQEYLSYDMLYQAGIPRTVPEWVILGVLMIFVVSILQFFLFMGYALTSPEGRRKTGDPTLKSRAANPYDYGQD